MPPAAKKAAAKPAEAPEAPADEAVVEATVEPVAEPVAEPVVEAADEIVEPTEADEPADETPADEDAEPEAEVTDLPPVAGAPIEPPPVIDPNAAPPAEPLPATVITDKLESNPGSRILHLDGSLPDAGDLFEGPDGAGQFVAKHRLIEHTSATVHSRKVELVLTAAGARYYAHEAIAITKRVAAQAEV